MGELLGFDIDGSPQDKSVIWDLIFLSRSLEPTVSDIHRKRYSMRLGDSMRQAGIQKVLSETTFFFSSFFS